MDLSHGHPTSLSSRNEPPSQHASYRHRATRSVPVNTPSPLSTVHRPEPPFTLQHRRLQLRNAGFRASRLPSHRLGIRFSKFFNSNDSPRSEHPHRTQENPPPQQSNTHILQKELRPSASLGILDEISNSTRIRPSHKRSTFPIQDDNPERPLLESSPVTTPIAYFDDDDYDVNDSPLAYTGNLNTMKRGRLREVSGNERLSPQPLHSPLARQMKGRQKRSHSLRKSSFEASQYIEHIENELQQVKEAMHSPNTGKPLHEKLKALKTENAQLKKSISELEESFEARLKGSVEHMTAIEADLKRKIKSLEDEISSKDCTIRDLEFHNEQFARDRNSTELLKATIERLEQEKQNLEDTNRATEKRNDVLTSLLAQSPTRTQYGFEPASPVRKDSRTTPRPKSLFIPKVPVPSPVRYRPSRAQSQQTSPALSASRNSLVTTGLSMGERNISQASGDTQQADSRSLDSGLGESCTLHSPSRSMSKGSSIVSHTSMGPAVWGLPLPTSPSDDRTTVRPTRHRKTRRFESGSTQLKPLLLSSISQESGGMQMSSPVADFSSAVPRDFSAQSIDPTTSFLSKPVDTPVSDQQTPPPFASEEALNALEGTSASHFESFEDILAQHEAILAGNLSSPTPGGLMEDLQRDDISGGAGPDFLNDAIIEDDVTAFLDPPMTDDDLDLSKASLLCHPSTSDPDLALPAADDLRDSGQYMVSREFAMPDHFCPIAFYDEIAYQPLLQGSFEQDQFIMPQPSSPSRDDATILSTPLGLVENDNPENLPALQDSSPKPRKRHRTSAHITPDSAFPTRSREHGLPAPNQNRDEADPGATDEEMGIDHESDRFKPKGRGRSPLERLRYSQALPADLTAVTAQTIFGTVSRYTSYMREMKKDPTALARRVIANAWYSNWARLGRLSWWVLGLFMGPGVTARSERSWDWEQYDGEDIAAKVVDSDMSLPYSPAGLAREDSPLLEQDEMRRVQLSQYQSSYQTSGTRTAARPALRPEHKRAATSWGKFLYLWGKFSIAIMLAVGGAVIEGPGEMLKDVENCAPRKESSFASEHSSQRRTGDPATLHPAQSDGEESARPYANNLHGTPRIQLPSPSGPRPPDGPLSLGPMPKTPTSAKTGTQTSAPHRSAPRAYKFPPEIGDDLRDRLVDISNAGPIPNQAVSPKA